MRTCSPRQDNRHVEGIIARRLAGLLVPVLQRLDQRLAGIGQHEIDDHRGAAGDRCARAGGKILERRGAHEGGPDACAGGDAARHDVAAGGVDLVIGRLAEVLADRDDLLVPDGDVACPVGEIGGDDGPAANQFRHSALPLKQLRPGALRLADGTGNLRPETFITGATNHVTSYG